MHPTRASRSTDASAPVVDAARTIAPDAGDVTDAEPDALTLPDASWCDSLSADAGVKQLLFCADFDDGNFSRVGETFLQWTPMLRFKLRTRFSNHLRLL